MEYMKNPIGVTFMIAWAVVPLYFWIRGVIKRNNNDRILAIVVIIILGFISTFQQVTYALDLVGLWVMGLGLITMVAALFSRFRDSLSYGALMLIVGVLMAIAV